jgi:hypothetical protein
MLVGRVVLIDQEGVGEIEPNSPERVAISRRLIDPDRAVTVMAHPQSNSLKCARVALKRGQIFVADD